MSPREPVNGSGRKALGWLMTLFGSGAIAVGGITLVEIRETRAAVAALAQDYHEHLGMSNEMVPILKRVDGEVRAMREDLGAIRGRIALIELRLDRLEQAR